MNKWWTNDGEEAVLPYKRIPINRCRRKELSTKLQNTKWRNHLNNYFYKQDPQTDIEIWKWKIFRGIRY